MPCRSSRDRAPRARTCVRLDGRFRHALGHRDVAFVLVVDGVDVHGGHAAGKGRNGKERKHRMRGDCVRVSLVESQCGGARSCDAGDRGALAATSESTTRGTDSDIGSGTVPSTLWRCGPDLGSSRPVLPREVDAPLAGGGRHSVANERVNAVLLALRATPSHSARGRRRGTPLRIQSSACGCRSTPLGP